MRFLLIAFISIFTLCLGIYVFTPVPFNTLLYAGWMGFAHLAFIYLVCSLCSQIFDIYHRFYEKDDDDKK